jgi:hypothetical protein
MIVKQVEARGRVSDDVRSGTTVPLDSLLVIHVCCNKLQILPSWLVLEQSTLHWHDFDPFVHTTVPDDDDSDKEDWDKTGQEDPLQVSTT